MPSAQYDISVVQGRFFYHQYKVSSITVIVVIGCLVLFITLGFYINKVKRRKQMSIIIKYENKCLKQFDSTKIS